MGAIKRTLEAGMLAAAMSGEAAAQEDHPEKAEFRSAYQGAIVEEPAATQRFIELADVYWNSDILAPDEAASLATTILEVAERNSKARQELKPILSDANFTFNLRTGELKQRLEQLLAVES